MNDGYIKVAAASVDVRVADLVYNTQKIWECMKEAIDQNIKVLVLPELAITGYTCGDLFGQSLLLKKAKEQLAYLIEQTKGSDLVTFVGMPWEECHCLYNVAAVIQNGKLLGIVTKLHIPNYSEFYEGRYFVPGPEQAKYILFDGYEVPFGSQILFQCKEMEALILAAEVCEDLWVPLPPSSHHALAGATVIANCSASNELSQKDDYRTSLILNQSARLHCAYLYSSAGEGESTQDLVFGGSTFITENGVCLEKGERFKNTMISSEIDLEHLASERRRKNIFYGHEENSYCTVYFSLEMEEVSFLRTINAFPFLPQNEYRSYEYFEEILTIQTMGLKKRLAHTNCKHGVIGLSGGLDSTLALLVLVRAFDQLGQNRSDIYGITMPCFGTTDRTYENACALAKELGITLLEIPIKESVILHLKEIGHEIDNHNVVYENAQARERTQVLMDVANQINGMVIGTGDLSELVLGWATYNGDHMSMYGVNASVPKTLVRRLVAHCASVQRKALKQVLLDILDTPVSPELLPPKDGEICQITEDLVGPYELHDFFLYQILRFGDTPKRVYRMASKAFEGQYDSSVILKWLRVFYRRFFAQQFKRSCLPDGVKVGIVSVSPRGDLRMPSDACSRMWLEELETIE